MRPMEVHCSDGDHLAHGNCPDSKNYWRSLSN
ncbi:hypothetical protein Goshw_021194 [Gossypium schwendimanii]|uniref:Uncharacterized protein n=1 Tax=Gossypium schwendimanii TaxID=34291 RepID=A0A7J9MWL9_GOSSC|nr:hypothetical protein [Gossypium schwendimanii]